VAGRAEPGGVDAGELRGGAGVPVRGVRDGGRGVGAGGVRSGRDCNEG